MDKLTKEQRHRNMMANKSRGTKIELILAKMLWNAGVRYRKNDKGVHGTPDFTLRGYKIAIFCDGEFWHGKDWEQNKERIKSNRDFWYAKIERNIERDKEINSQLENDGWKVFRFWETDIRKQADECIRQVLGYIQKRSNKSKPIISQITEEQRIPVQIAEGKQLAVVSHYLYNQDQPSVEPFVQPAKNIISKLYDLDEQHPNLDSLVAEPEIQYSLGSNLHTAPFPAQPEPTFTFVDLFAGIGGIRLALQELGGRCVFCSEWDIEAQYTYLLNFGEAPFGDITDPVVKGYIPQEFDVLCGSIPSQRFTFTGKKSSMEKMRGTLFYHFTEIIKDKRPKAFLVETDSNILSSDKGYNMEILLDTLRNGLAYDVAEPQKLSACDFGLPHNTQRIYIFGFRKDIDSDKITEAKTGNIIDVHELLHDKNAPKNQTTFGDIKETHPVLTQYYLSEQVMNTLTQQKQLAGTTCKSWKYEAATHNAVLHVLLGNKLNHNHNFVIDYTQNKFSIPANYKGTPNKKGVRKLTPREMARLQGFPDDFILQQKDNTSYKLLENASTVTMVKSVAKIIRDVLLLAHAFK